MTAGYQYRNIFMADEIACPLACGRDPRCEGSSGGPDDQPAFLRRRRSLPCRHASFPSLGAVRDSRILRILSLACTTLASLLLAVLSLFILLTGVPFTPAAWQLFPGVSVEFFIDRLAAFFLFLIGSVSACVAVYTMGYVEHMEGGNRRNLLCGCISLFVLAMALIVASENTISFLLFWELMAAVSFFLVMYEYSQEETRKAGIFYFVMTHLSTLFVMLGVHRALVRIRFVCDRPAARHSRIAAPCYCRVPRALCRFFHQGRDHPVPQVASLRSPGKPVAGVGTYVGRDAQGRRLRPPPVHHHGLLTRSLVGRADPHRRHLVSGARRDIRTQGTRHKRDAGVLEYREYRHHLCRHRPLCDVLLPGARGACDPQPACGALSLPQPCALQKPPLPYGRIGGARHAHPGHREDGRALRENALHLGTLLYRRDCHCRPSPVKRLCKRTFDVHRVLPVRDRGRSPHQSPPFHLPCPLCTHERTLGSLFCQGVRLHLPCPAAFTGERRLPAR